VFRIRNFSSAQGSNGLHLAAILPVFNEAKLVNGVLEVLRGVELLSKILVVDDGSTDGTAERIREATRLDARIRLIQHRTNAGKGQAIFTAWRATSASYLLLLDADLVNLTPQHIYDLAAPVIAHQADMTLGLFRGGQFNTDFSHWLTPWLSGQRCLRAEILSYVSERAAAGYGFEVALSIAARQHGYRVQHVGLKGVWHPPSELHRGLLGGLLWRLRMYGQIIRAWLVTVDERWLEAKAEAKAILSDILKT
jgi:glycosyltransferase involved in cell wall biosynthesis